MEYVLECMGLSQINSCSTASDQGSHYPHCSFNLNPICKSIIPTHLSLRLSSLPHLTTRKVDWSDKGQNNLTVTMVAGREVEYRGGDSN